MNGQDKQKQKILIASQQPLLRLMAERGINPSDTYRAWLENVIKKRWGTTVNWETDGKSAHAEISTNNWSVACPDPLCGNADIIEPGQPQYCTECQNMNNGYKARKVIWPKDRFKIEAELLKRPPGKRHYAKGQTLANIKKENADAGIK